MIQVEEKVCAICGNTFMGSYKQKYCSATCRLESMRRSNLKYRAENKDKLNEKARQYRADLKAKEAAAENQIALLRKGKVEISVQKHAKIPQKSRWSKKYMAATRLDKIAMLCTALEKHGYGIFHYGYISSIYLSNEYYRLLRLVLIAEENKKGGSNYEIHT